MKFTLIMSDSAVEELSAVVAYIAQNSRTRAQEYKDKVIDKLTALAENPYLGKPHTIDKLKKSGYRKLAIESHTAHYLVDEDRKQIHVIRILHNAMDEKKALKK